MIPPLPETYFVLCEYDFPDRDYRCFDQAEPGTKIAEVIQRFIDDDFLGKPLAVYRIKEGAPVTNVSEYVAGELLARRDLKGVMLSEMALDFCESWGVKARPFVF